MIHRLPSPLHRPALLALATTAAAWAALAPATADACSCVSPPPPAQAKESAAAVFEGRVTRIEDPDTQPKVHFQVVRSFKGPSHETLTVRTASNSAACGYGFEEGKSYLVYASDEGGLTTSLCSRTQPIEHAAGDLSELGLGNTPFDPGAGSDQQQPPSSPAGQAAKGGCASCAVGARANDGNESASRSLGGLALVALAAAYRLTCRRRSGSRS